MSDAKFWNMMYRLAQDESGEGSGDQEVRNPNKDGRNLREWTKEQDKKRKKASILSGLIRVAYSNPDHRSDLLPIIATELSKEARRRMRRVRIRKRGPKVDLHKAVGVDKKEKWQKMDLKKKIKMLERSYERLSKRRNPNKRQQKALKKMRFWYSSLGRKWRPRRKKFFKKIQRMRKRLKR